MFPIFGKGWTQNICRPDWMISLWQFLNYSNIQFCRVDNGHQREKQGGHLQNYSVEYRGKENIQLLLAIVTGRTTV
jgi:hypothetical protein